MPVRTPQPFPRPNFWLIKVYPSASAACLVPSVEPPSTTSTSKSGGISGARAFSAASSFSVGSSSKRSRGILERLLLLRDIPFLAEDFLDLFYGRADVALRVRDQVNLGRLQLRSDLRV